MTPERYQLIDEIFQAALELDPERRSAFLDEACSNDVTLRSDVESLLTSDLEGLSFIDNQVLDIAATLLAREEPELVAGEHIDRYEILSLLGSGGMGEVYLAHDDRLKRRIAFKLLPHYLTTNQDSLQRFQQEARAASALNHPNIITIYEIGQADHYHFIATELVDGQTLRRRLRESSISLQESLEIAIQICRALSAAHQAGIIHRDIKPENIMLRRDGYVKVVDFGLAKLTEHHEQRIDIGADQRLDLSSSLLMGTLPYMSPEQAQGLAVDQRSDIFSFGVVLYEMVAGRVPFHYENRGDLISSITKEKPPPLKRHSPSASDGLQEIIDKALRKEREARYQTADDIMRDLLRLKEQSATHGVAYLTDKIKQHRIAASVALLLLVIGSAATLLQLTRLFKGKHVPFKQTRFTKLTNFGDAWLPAISPDGTYVAYVKMSTTAGQNSLWLRAVGTTNERLLVTVTDGFINGTKFLPDSEHVAYETDAGTFVVPTSGGEPTKLPTKGLAFSPDSRHVAYLDNRLSEGKTVLVVANADGTGRQDITTRQAPNYYWTASTAAWSPDGKLIACIGQNGNEGFGRVFVIDVDKRTETSLTDQKWNVIFGINWLPDMSGLLIVASEETSSILQIWEILYPGGEARRITNDTVNYLEVSLTADGKTLVTTKAETPTSIWLMPVEGDKPQSEKSAKRSIDTGRATQINVTNFGTSQFVGYARLSWTPDGKRIVYMSEESGNGDIWSMNADGSDRKQLTFDPRWDTGAVVSPDGRSIVFMSNRAGAENIWLMDIDGENQRRLTSKLIERSPVFSADSRWVYFLSWETGKATVWRIPVEGGQSTQVISDLSFNPALSPEGKFLLYRGSAGKIYITSAEGGPPLKVFEQLGGTYSWTPDGRALVLVSSFSNNVFNVWEQPLDGSKPRPLTNFSSEGIGTYAFSPDGKQVVVTRSHSTSDIVLISEDQ